MKATAELTLFGCNSDLDLYKVKMANNQRILFVVSNHQELGMIRSVIRSILYRQREAYLHVTKAQSKILRTTKSAKNS